MRSAANSRIMRCFWIHLFLLATVVSAAPPRWLEDAEEGGGNYNNNGDLSNFSIRQGTCFRMKIVNDNDDDGNSYFYNGAYRAQYTRYISFELCSDQKCTNYVTELDSYLEETVYYVQNMCGACANQCGGNRRLFAASGGARRLEEEGGGENNNNNMYVDCNTCVSECQLLNSDKGNDGTDESNYLQCQADYEDGDVQYYTAPQCESGQVVIGHFYDDECTIKTSTLQDSGFSYNTFETMASVGVDCSLSNDVCQDLFGNAVLCEDGYAEENDEDDSKLCKAAKAANRVQTFYRKPFYKKAHLVPVFLLVFVLGFGISFMAYTYYVRHKRLQSEQAKVPMAELDGSHLPPVT